MAGNKLDYRRYGEVLPHPLPLPFPLSFLLFLLVLFPPPRPLPPLPPCSPGPLPPPIFQALLEILIAGGLLAPGGSIQQDGEEGKACSTRACIFQDAVDLPRIKAWDNVIIKLMRRYKYLEKMLSEEMKKILVYLRWAQLWPTLLVTRVKHFTRRSHPHVIHAADVL